ncbi:MAG: FAD-binding protein [Rhodospirillales bacterium]|nr:FAD-binding protein [Rhodospirillales bacterium]MSP80465.1 FAD-binding protein [Rhodospirillales bacterium]
MSEIFKPARPAAVAEVLVQAKGAIEVRGRGSKRALGRPVPEGLAVLDLSGLAGITLYEPEELVMSARAGTPIADVRAALAEKNQELAFDPPDYSGLFGGRDAGTLGGAIACNLSGSRRIKSGAARDHILGFAGVNGRGEEFKSGGRVMKNVTGFDLSKLIAGSYGTLAALTDVTVKVLPRPEKIRTVLVFGLAADPAVGVLRESLGSSHEVAAAAYLPQDVAQTSAVDLVARAGASVAALRIEGHGPSAEYRCRALKGVLDGRGATEELHTQKSEIFWREVRDVAAFAADPVAQIWRLSVPPADGARVAGAIAARLKGRYFLDWGGGLVWFALAPLPDAGAEVVRSVLPPDGGQATLIRAEAGVRARVAVFQPLPPALAELTRRVKEGFDPDRRLNPGRMFADV